MSSEKFKLAVLVSGRGSNLQAIIDSVEKSNLAAEISLVLSNVKDAYALERGKKHGLEAVFLNPKIYPKKTSEPKGRPEASREPFWSHFGWILERFSNHSSLPGAPLPGFPGTCF